MTKNIYLTSLKAVEVWSSVYVWNISNIQITEHAFFAKSTSTETVELGHRSVYIDVSLIEHTMMQMKTMDHMRTVNTLIAN